MTYDTESPPGSWRQERFLIAGSIAELREIIIDLEHCLKIARQETKDAQTKNDLLITQLAEISAANIEMLDKNRKLKREIDHIWKLLRGNPDD